MRYFIISDDMDVLVGMRLAGIEGGLAATSAEAEALLAYVRSDEQIAVLLITEASAAMCREAIDALRLSAARPMVAVIPGLDGLYSEPDAISRLIRETIGIKI